MNTISKPTILTEDVVRIDKYLPNPYYDPVHLLQMAHNAHMETRYAIRMRKREWAAFLKDGDDGELAKFEVFTVWSDHSDCMDVLTTTIYYDPRSSSGIDRTFCVTQSMLAMSLAYKYRMTSPLFHCASEEELRAFLEDDETPFKRYLHLEHIMERLRESDEGQATIRQIEREQREKQKKESNAWFERKPQSPKELYYYLTQYEYTCHPYQRGDDREAVTLLEQSINGWWKPRYIVDNACCEAYEFMNEAEQLLTITDDDIEWDSLKGLTAAIVARAKARDGHFPVLFSRFHLGKAEVQWQLNPDGRYYMDEDGYGMTDDEEITLVGAVDRTGRVIQKFRYN